MAVFAQCVAHEAQFAGRLAFVVEPRSGVGARCVRGVAAGLAFEIGVDDVAAAGVSGLVIVLGHDIALVGVCAVVVVFVVAAIDVVAVLARKALVTGPSLDQGAVDVEVLTRQPPLVVCGFKDEVKQRNDRVVGNQAFSVLGKDGGHLLRSFFQWRMLPDEFSKWRTVHSYFAIWSEPREGDSLLEQALKKSKLARPARNWGATAAARSWSSTR